MYSQRLCHLPAKHECYVLHGSVETLFRGGGKHLRHVMANLVWKICTKFYQNRSRFVKDTRKTYWCVFGSQSQLLFTRKTRTVSFAR